MNRFFNPFVSAPKFYISLPDKRLYYKKIPFNNRRLSNALMEKNLGADTKGLNDRIPAGKYWVTAWHPYLGEVSQEVTVSGGADVKADFELLGS